MKRERADKSGGGIRREIQSEGSGEKKREREKGEEREREI
jgi:hypothetical protein